MNAWMNERTTKWRFLFLSSLSLSLCLTWRLLYSSHLLTSCVSIWLQYVGHGFTIKFFLEGKSFPQFFWAKGATLILWSWIPLCHQDNIIRYSLWLYQFWILTVPQLHSVTHLNSECILHGTTATLFKYRHDLSFMVWVGEIPFCECVMKGIPRKWTFLRCTSTFI